jgi:N-acetylglucosaminyl-diphospho-decaprenol L-rhamnosyltransferase
MPKHAITMTDLTPVRLPLAIIVLTLNEERHLPECLASAAGLAERTLIVDSGSKDETVTIARQIGVDIVFNEFRGYASQRNSALEMVSQEWVLFLDADERLTPELRRELTETIQHAPDDVSGFWIPRRNIMFGHELRGGGWNPDYQLRLLRRAKAQYAPQREVHEIVQVDGQIGTLNHAMLHLNYDSFVEFRAKQEVYSRVRARELAEEGIRPRKRSYVGRPAREFWRRFVTLSGYRDGLTGARLALAMARYEIQVLTQIDDLITDKQLNATSDDRAICRTAFQPMLSQSPAVIDLSIIIVSYNVRDYLLNCLASIEAWLAATSYQTEVIVVDNASHDGSADSVRRRFPETNIIELGANIGFAAANNRAAEAARGRFIVFLNPDTTVVGDAFGVMARYLDEHYDVGVVGPRLRYPDGTIQSTRRRFPTRRTGFLESTIVQQYWRDNAVLRRYYVADRSNDETQDVDWLVGACLFTRRETLERAGLFDERFFMYSEEVEWCHRVRESDWRVVYLPSASIVHHEGTSSKLDLPVRQINFDTSKVLLYEELHGKRSALALRGFLLGSYLLRALIEAAKGLLGHKRSLRKERVRLYLRAFKSGLRGRSETR